MLAKMRQDSLKMHQIAFGGRAPPGPAGGALSRPPSRNQGVLLLRGGEERRDKERGGEGKGRNGEERDGKGKGAGERNGREGKGKSWIRRCVVRHTDYSANHDCQAHLEIPFPMRTQCVARLVENTYTGVFVP